MAEGMLRHLAGDRFTVYSAGSHPAGFIHPLAIDTLARMDISLDGHVSKSWDVYANTPMELVITVCDNAAGETCPVWSGAPLQAHWPLPDPVYQAGSAAEQLEFASRIAQRLRTKIEGLIEIDWTATSHTIEDRLKFLGEI